MKRKLRKGRLRKRGAVRTKLGSRRAGRRLVGWRSMRSVRGRLRGRRRRSVRRARTRNRDYTQAYNEGYNAGFGKGFEDGHLIAYEQQA